MSLPTAILLLHFKNSQYTKLCLDSLLKAHQNSTFTTYILSIQSNQIDELKNHPLHPHIQETTQNGGFSWANNVLMKQAFKDGCTNIILLNNDTEVDEHFVRPLVDRLQEPTVGLVCSKIYFYPGFEFHHDAYQESERGKVIWYGGGIIDWNNVYAFHAGVDEVDHGQFNESFETDFATGCSIAATRQTIEKIGYMDEKYFMYLEDLDWSLKAKRQGLKIIFEPKSVVWHKNAGSSGGPGSKLHLYYQTRNRFYFGMKYAPIKTKLHLFKNTIEQVKDENPIISHAAKDALTCHLGRQDTI